VKSPLKKFLDRAKHLEEHLGPILYQLPPRWRLNIPRLESFLDLLPEDLSHVIEFRDPSWLAQKVYQLLEERGISFCSHDLPGTVFASDSHRLAIGSIVYVRFHGAGQKYGGAYPEPTLRSWAKWIEQQAHGGLDVYAYFNNDTEAHAVHDARLLKRKIGSFR
jgi:uncharacterized protein YecE (DUF72 family)